MIRMFFGSPGCGKTTICHFLTAHSNYEHYLCNFDSKMITDKIDIKELGKFSIPPNTKLYVDEAGICWNNRNFKNFSKNTIEYLKKHRHEGVDIDVFSQSWEDVDVTVRRLVDELWFLKKIGPFTFCRRIQKFIAPPNKDNQWQIQDGYRFRGLLWKFIPLLGFRSWFIVFRPLYYKYFDSFDKLPLPPYPIPLKPHKKNNILLSLIRKF